VDFRFSFKLNQRFRAKAHFVAQKIRKILVPSLLELVLATKSYESLKVGYLCNK
jgi:hypothetical protein